jgi:hypothetical protein
MDGLSFSDALGHMALGYAIARRGWNGKDMYLWLVKGSLAYDAPAPDAGLIDGVPERLFLRDGNGTATRLPHIAMKVASGATQHGWLASLTDMLASDWYVIGNAAPPSA